MMRSGNSIKKVLLGILILGLSCAIWQNYVPVFKIKKLEGKFKKDTPVLLNWENWFSGDYQLYVEKHIVLNNALSPFLVRLHNQMDYSFFDKLHASDGILGKENYLDSKEYVSAYLGRDFVGIDTLRVYVEKMKFVQDTLQKLNKKFIYIQAPGKTSFYPEYLPDSLQMKEPEMSNYNQLRKLLAEYHIDHIDFKPYFLAMKDTSTYPLFTQTGIHWSRFSMALVMDSIYTYIESSMKIDLPKLYYDRVESGYAKYEDADMEKVLNLLFIMSNVQYAYPEYKSEPHENKDVPVVLMIGDSYLGNLYWGHFYESFSKQSQFWFYNTSVYASEFPDKAHRYQLDQMQVVNNSDIILLGCNEPNIRGMSWSFIDDAYNYYKYGRRKSESRAAYMKKVDQWKTRMTDTDYADIVELAKSQKISVDSAKTVFYMWKVQDSL
jgi:hypothetical protein